MTAGTVPTNSGVNLLKDIVRHHNHGLVAMPRRAGRDVQSYRDAVIGEVRQPIANARKSVKTAPQ